MCDGPDLMLFTQMLSHEEYSQFYALNSSSSRKKILFTYTLTWIYIVPSNVSMAPVWKVSHLVHCINCMQHSLEESRPCYIDIWRKYPWQMRESEVTQLLRPHSHFFHTTYHADENWKIEIEKRKIMNRILRAFAKMFPVLLLWIPSMSCVDVSIETLSPIHVGAGEQFAGKVLEILEGRSRIHCVIL